MKPTNRRTAALFAAGFGLAGLTGWTVWASSSTAPSDHAGFSAEAADTTSAHSTTSSTSSSRTATNSSTTETSADGRTDGNDAPVDQDYSAQHGMQGGTHHVNPNYAAQNDPYLPPHAVVGQADPAQPTKVYRPTNIVVPPPAQSAQSAQQAPQSQRSGPQSASQSTRPSGTTSEERPNRPETTPESPSESRPQPTPEASHPSTPDTPGTSAQTPTETDSAGTSGIPTAPSEPERGPGTSADNEPKIKDGKPAPGSSPAEPTSRENDRDEHPENNKAIPADQLEAQLQSQASAPTTARARVPGKEDVAGYPQPDEGFSPREALDQIARSVTR